MRTDGRVRRAPIGVAGTLLRDPRERFDDRVLTLRGDGTTVTVSYGPYGADPACEAVNQLWNNTEAIARHTARLRDLAPTDLDDLGTRLGWIAMPAPVRHRFLTEFRAAEKSGRKVRLWIHDDESGLEAMPWEFVYLEEVESGFLGLHPACSIIRYCPVAPAVADATPRSLAADEPLEVLIVYADPDIPDFRTLAALPQIERVQHILSRLTWPTRLSLLLPRSQTSDADRIASRVNVERAVRDISPHVILVVAHGDFDEDHDRGVVFLEDGESAAFDRVTAGDFAGLVPAQGGPTIFLLDCCWSGRGVARALCAPGRTIVSMQFAWPSATAPIFWNTLLSSFAAPSPLDDCVFEGRDMVYANSLNTPDWGFPVVLRPGVPLHKRAPEGHEPRWRRDLVSIRHRLAGRDRDLIDEMLNRLPEWAERFDIGSLVQEVDPLMVLTAGESDREHAPIATSPVWWTRLLTAPRRFQWRAGQSGPWWLSVWIAGGDELVFRETSEPAVDLEDDETRHWPAGAWIRWHVRNDTTRNRGGPALVRGAFQVVAGSVPVDWRRRVKQHGLGIDRRIAGVAPLLTEGLHDALRLRCSTLLQRHLSPAARFAIHRMLAAAYGEMHRQLSLLGLGHPEGLWAAALARQHVEAGYRAAAGAGSTSEAET